ncbi:TPA: AAA family ATPase [Bacillus cereus]
MNNVGFYIKKIMVYGENMEAAAVDFEKGLNIISGPSDTGKSYIFQCINYMLGSSDKPKEIDESIGYSSVFMEIETYSGDTYTLKRVVGKNEVNVYKTAICDIKKATPISLKCKHHKEKKDNISAFLLKKSGFNHPSYVKEKKSGEIRTLSFRDFPTYIAISEGKIIKEVSPILSGQYTKTTVEQSIFKLMISGLDDSDQEGIQKEDISSKTKLQGQKELLERLIHQEEKELLDFSIGHLGTEFVLDNKMREIQDELNSINEEINNQTTLRRSSWNEIEEDKSKYIAVSELIKRFQLLEEQYNSDLERLIFVREGNYYFSQLNFAVCPFCNQRVENTYCNGGKHDFNQTDTNLAESIEAEMNKIKLYLSDLQSTIKETESEQGELYNEIEEKKYRYNQTNDRINLMLEPRETNLKELLNNYILERDLLANYEVRVAKVADMNKEKKIIEDKLKKPSQTVTNDENEGLILEALKDFCEYMSNTLKRWKFSKKPIVTYEKGHFYVDSKPAKDYGKGYRSIIYSAFAISLMEFCKENNKPHPGFVVLDSPLTPYQGKKLTKNDELSEEVKMDIQSAFFKDLSSIKKDMQVIIFENKEPNGKIKEKINYIEFTKDESYGRYGFFARNRIF